MKPAQIILYAVEIICSASANRIEFYRFSEGLELWCKAIDFDYKWPVQVKMLKDGLDEPIISGNFSSSQIFLNGTIISNDSCYSLSKLNKPLQPCYTEMKLQTSNNFWFCGFLAEGCGTYREYEALLLFQLDWLWALPFIHWGNYTCQAIQNDILVEETLLMEGIFLTSVRTSVIG